MIIMGENTPIQRITGTEMEWRGTISDKRIPDSLVEVNESCMEVRIKDYLTDMNIASVGMHNNLFLSNGARFYVDVNDLREYATPEDNSFLGTTANEIASELIMQDIARSFREQTRDDPKLSETQISYSKRVLADNETSNGYHISYSVDRRFVNPSDQRTLGLFGVFAATRSVLFGTGALLPNGHLTIAQKTLTVSTDFSTNTIRNKPVVNLRDEPLADYTKFTRLHDTSADPTMSPWATRVKLGAASLVLRMIECGLTLEDLRFERDLNEVARIVALDTSLTERFRLLSGRPVTALDVQRTLATYARKMADFSEVKLTDEELWTIDEWERAIADMEQNPDLTIDRVDWVMRRAVLARQHERKGYAWDSQILRYKDRQFSEVAFDGIAMALREKRWSTYMPPESLINERRVNAPKETRATLRQQFIEGVKDFSNAATVSWSFVKLKQDKINLPNPYQKQSNILTALLEKASLDPQTYACPENYDEADPNDYAEY